MQIDLIDVFILWQEEDPGWYSRVPEFNSEPVVDIQMHVSHTMDYWLLSFLHVQIFFEISDSIVLSFNPPSQCLVLNRFSKLSIFFHFVRNQKKSHRLYRLPQMEHQFQNQKSFLKTAVPWKHRTKMLFWKALVLLVLLTNGHHYQSVVIVRNLVMRCARCLSFPFLHLILLFFFLITFIVLIRTLVVVAWSDCITR